MKKLLLVTALLISASGFAQFSFGYYGLHNMHTGFRSGWGFGMDGLSRHLAYTPCMEKLPVKFQIGGGYSILGAGSKTFSNVVLEDGGVPMDVSLTNLQMTLHGIMRVSVPSQNGRYTLYGEVIPGVRMNNSTVGINNEDHTGNCTSYVANSSTGFNLGLSGGLMMQLNKSVALDAGVVWDKVYNPGNMILMNSANVNDGLSYAMSPAPPSVLTFRFGLRIYVNSEDYGGCCTVEGCKIPRHHTRCGNTHVHN